MFKYRLSISRQTFKDGWCIPVAPQTFVGRRLGEQDVPYSRQTFGSVFTVLLISLQFCDVKLPNYLRIFLRSRALPSLACSPRDAKFLPQQLLLKLFLNRLWRPVFETFHLQTLQNHNQCQIIFFDN